MKILTVTDCVSILVKKLRMVVCLEVIAFKPATLSITDPQHTMFLDMSTTPQKLIDIFQCYYCLLETLHFRREYHAYMDIWTPAIGQTLLVKRESSKPKGKNAMAVYEEDSIVGHVQFTLPLSIFGKRCQQGLC